MRASAAGPSNAALSMRGNPSAIAPRLESEQRLSMPTRGNEERKQDGAFRRACAAALGLVIVVAVLVLGVSVLPGLEDVRERFNRADPAWLAVTFACAMASRSSRRLRADWRTEWG